MARFFFDSSALVKRYHQESGTPQVEALFASPDNRFFVSRLALLELHSTFARLVREGILASEGWTALIANLQNDVATGLLMVAAVSSQRLGEASQLLGTRGLSLPLRTLDAIHLATAEALHRRTPLAGFVAADQKLLAVARECGLPVIDVS